MGGLQFVVTTTFNGRFNTQRIAGQYEKLSNVRYAEANIIRGDQYGDLCLEIRNDSHLYIFDTGVGDCDCANGCLNHIYQGFSVDRDGNITDLGGFSRFDDNSRVQEPGWFTNASECRAFL